MSQDKEREAFEAHDPKNIDYSRKEDGEYVDPFTEGEWQMWSAGWRAALASQQAVKGEPVAWALLTNGKPNAPRGRTLSWEPPCNESLQIAAIEGESWIPLFASPPSREPLTELLIEAEFGSDSNESYPDFLAGVRFAERAHGIHSREGESK